MRTIPVEYPLAQRNNTVSCLDLQTKVGLSQVIALLLMRYRICDDQAHQGRATQVKKAPRCGPSQTESASMASKRPQHQTSALFHRARTNRAAWSAPSPASDPQAQASSPCGCQGWTPAAHRSVGNVKASPWIRSSGSEAAAAGERAGRAGRADNREGALVARLNPREASRRRWEGQGGWVIRRISNGHTGVARQRTELPGER